MLLTEIFYISGGSMVVIASILIEWQILLTIPGEIINTCLIGNTEKSKFVDTSLLYFATKPILFHGLKKFITLVKPNNKQRSKVEENWKKYY